MIINLSASTKAISALSTNVSKIEGSDLYLYQIDNLQYPLNWLVESDPVIAWYAKIFRTSKGDKEPLMVCTGIHLGSLLVSAFIHTSDAVFMTDWQ